MPTYRISGDVLQAFIVEVDAVDREAAMAKLEQDPHAIHCDEVSVRFDWDFELDEDGNEIEEIEETPLLTLTREATKDEDDAYGPNFG